MTSIIVLGGIVLGVVGCIAAAYFYGRSAGRTAADAAVLGKTASVQRAQLDAAGRAPRGKEAVLDRLRDGGGL